MRSHDTDADEDAGHEHLATADGREQEHAVADDDEFDDVDDDDEDDEEEDAVEDTDTDA